jgi:hypothetical protein
MAGQVVDALGQPHDLHLSRPGVGAVEAKLPCGVRGFSRDGHE